MKHTPKHMNLLNVSGKQIGLIAIAILFFSITGCRKKTAPVVSETTESHAPITTTSTTEEIDTPYKSTSEIQEPTTTSPFVKNKSFVKNKENEEEIATTTPKKTVVRTMTVPSSFKIYHNLTKILSLIKNGQTLTKEQLLASDDFPEDACKTIKSITKISENEMKIIWKSKWMVESISDVQLEDDQLKVILKNGLVYTSGNAIGIEYEGKVYNNLIIKGDRAYIASVKKYSWKIGS